MKFLVERNLKGKLDEYIDDEIEVTKICLELTNSNGFTFKKLI